MDRRHPPLAHRLRHARTTIDDLVWRTLCNEAESVVQTEPLLASSLHATILSHVRLEDALSYHLAGKLASNTMGAVLVRDVISRAFDEAPALGAAMRADLLAFRDRDAASSGVLAPLM